MKDTYQNEFQKEKKMLSLLFTICIIWFVGKFFVFGLRASWGIMKAIIDKYLPKVAEGKIKEIATLENVEPIQVQEAIKKLQL